jgi:hypothetical protein
VRQKLALESFLKYFLKNIAGIADPQKMRLNLKLVYYSFFPQKRVLILCHFKAYEYPKMQYSRYSRQKLHNPSGLILEKLLRN